MLKKTRAGLPDSWDTPTTELAPLRTEQWYYPHKTAGGFCLLPNYKLNAWTINLNLVYVGNNFRLLLLYGGAVPVYAEMNNGRLPAYSGSYRSALSG
jgi:hypothetical protein